jgi:hypothetical protein
MRTNMGTLTVPRTRNNCQNQTKAKLRCRAASAVVVSRRNGRVLHRERQRRSQALAYVYYEDEPGVASAIIPATL